MTQTKVNEPKREMPVHVKELPSPHGTPPFKGILVHQPGKVGSTSIFESILYSVPLPVYQTHSMNRDLPYLSDEEVDRFDDKDSKWPIHIRKAQRFVFHYIRPGRPIAVITLVRDPIARSVSDFFQNLSRYPELADLSNPAPIEDYRQTYLEKHDHEFMDRWFDHHIKEPFGVDWFDGPFDPSAGHATRTNGKNAYLLMQLELPDETKQRVVRDFLGFDGFNLNITANVGEQKDYAEIYRAFREIPFPRDYLDRMCGSRVARHFYTPQQLAAFRAKWE